MNDIYQPLAVADLSKSSPTNTINNATSDWKSGMKTGAEIGSIVPGVGTVIGGTIGAATGALGNALGYGKTKSIGHSQLGSWQTDNPGTLGRVSQDQYNNYNNAANYLNAYNDTLSNDWSHVGSSAYGVDKYKTRQIIGSDKSSKPYWEVGYNTGYNVLDDYTNKSLGNWEQYMNQMSDAYGNKLGSAVSNLQDQYKNDLNSRYGLGAATDKVMAADQAQKELANTLLNNIYYGGNISGRALEGARSDVDKQSVANRKNLYDIANAQNNAWSDMMAQMIANDKGAQNNQDDWIKNYNLWNRWASGRGSDLLTDTANRAQNYADTFINDSYYDALLNGTDTYLPHNAIAQAYADPRTEQINPLQAWGDLLLSGKKRKAKKVGE